MSRVTVTRETRAWASRLVVLSLHRLVDYLQNCFLKRIIEYGYQRPYRAPCRKLSKIHHGLYFTTVFEVAHIDDRAAFPYWFPCAAYDLGNDDSELQEHEIKTLFGRKVAIDASMSIYQFLIAVRQKDGELLTNDAGETTRYAPPVIFPSCVSTLLLAVI